MRAVAISAFGGSEVMQVRDLAAPVPELGQVLIRVAAAGVNPVDWKIRDGYMKDLVPFTFPTILGNEVAGTVEAVADGVTGFAVGDAVHAATGLTGGFADLVAVAADMVAPIPSRLTAIEAAGVPVAAATAIAALDAGGVRAGSRILIHAASGGVGSLALQLACARGAEVTALASPDNLDFVRGLGAS
ncbi:MAG: NADP-dependent oxidoreductase, partial [Janthinobacterium lividum]